MAAAEADAEADELDAAAEPLAGFSELLLLQAATREQRTRQEARAKRTVCQTKRTRGRASTADEPDGLSLVLDLADEELFFPGGLFAQVEHDEPSLA